MIRILRFHPWCVFALLCFGSLSGAQCQPHIQRCRLQTLVELQVYARAVLDRPLCNLFVCARSHAGFGGSDCSKCPAGTYSSGGSTAPCVACGPGQSSQPGSAGPEYCQCPAGQGLVNAGDTVCSVCPSGYYQPGPLTVQDADKAGSNVRETGLAQCKLCPDGRVSLPGTKLSDDCGECFQQQLCTYVVRQHKMIPLACASRTAVSQGVLDCRPLYVQTCNVCCGIGPVMSCVLCCHVLPCVCTVCPAGTYGADCSTCTAGSWCPGGKQAAINACGPNRFSLVGAKSPSDCFCVPGVLSAGLYRKSRQAECASASDVRLLVGRPQSTICTASRFHACCQLSKL